MHARPIRSSLGPDPNGSAPVCTGPKTTVRKVQASSFLDTLNFVHPRHSRYSTASGLVLHCPYTIYSPAGFFKKSFRIAHIQGWRQEFFDGGLTFPTRGLKYGL